MSSCLSDGSPSRFLLPPGPSVVPQRSSDRSAVRRLGTQVLPAANGLLHVRAHPADEDQPVVRAARPPAEMLFQLPLLTVVFTKPSSPLGGTLPSSPCLEFLPSPSP